MPSEEQAKLSRWMGDQAGWCRRLGSELYAILLDHAAGDVEDGGPCWQLLEEHSWDPGRSLLALRFMGAVHRLVLEGRAPALTRYYPSVGGDPRAPGAWEAFRETVGEQQEALRALISYPVQTNEVGRCVALLGGFLLVAQRTGLPLRLFEIGASAGLNLRWDQYFYDAGDASWGEPSSPVRLDATFLNGRPPLDVQARIAERRGCDTLPIDPRTQEGQLTLMSYVWPDQTERLDLLRGAIEVARRVPVLVEAADAADWLKEQLEKPSPQQATIVFHSVVLQYLSEQGRGAVRMILEEAGRRASGDAPLAWLRMEPGESDADIHLTLWPDETERHIATSGYHGRPVRWLERQPRRT